MSIVPNKDAVMSQGEYDLLRDLIRDRFGIALRGDKRLSLHTRISHRLALLGLGTYQAYYDYIVADRTDAELMNLVIHVTNNETYFFRERSQLAVFSELLQEIKRSKSRGVSRTLDLLSVACSSGEEPYTLNVLVQESGLFAWNWDVRITGIDIDREALAKARAATYSSHSLRVNGGPDIRQKYFYPDDQIYVLRMPFRRGVRFRQGNILDPTTFEGLSELDVVFCRNVLIYMDDAILPQILENIHGALADDGYLIIGTSESLIQRTDLFRPEYRSGVIVYRKNVPD